MVLSTLLTGRNALFAAAIYAITQTLKTIAPKFFAGKIGQRLLPVIPLVLGIVGGVLGVPDGVTRMQDKIVIGIVAAFASSHLFKLGRTSVLGWGLGSGEPAPPATPPATPALPSDTPATVDSPKDPS